VYVAAMTTPVQVVFRGMEPSAAAYDRIRERASDLDRLLPGIVSTHVTVQAPHHHHHKGQLYEVRVVVHAPGQEVVVNREGVQDHAHEDVFVAIRDAFDALERRLQDLARRRDHRMAQHAVPSHGRIARISFHEGYGFVETADGLEVYFHEHSVVGGRFAALQVGDEVRIEIADRESDKGPQASTVRPIGKHHLVE
jgi:cold shock CspA family protein/ribosome-associated translation inhibitor RaiA